MAQLRLAPQARGADARAPRQLGERAVAIGDEGVERHLARAEGREREPGWQHHRHVLHRMHRDLGAAGVDGGLELLHEQPLPTHLRERSVEHAVALGGHGNQLHLESRVARGEGGRDGARLGEGELAFARGDADRAG
jgi:hypothetical protein